MGSFLGPVLVLGIPIADASLAIFRRTLLLFYAAALILGALGVAVGVF